MQLRLVSVELNNFKSYNGPHEWILPTEAGLYYITGKNKFNRRLGSNGIGKSTLVDAINWALYGKTSRGLRAGDIVTWGKNSCKVSVKFLIDVEEVIITRSQRPNKILINDKPSTQDEVDKLIRLNQDAFNNSMILPQFGESFLDLSPTNKLTMFSQIMDLDYWLDKSKKADNAAATISNQINNIENKSARAKGNIERLKESITDLKQKSADFNSSIKIEIEDIEGKIKIADKKVKEHKHNLEDLQEVLGETKTKRDEAKDRYEAASKLASEKNRKVTELQTLIKANDRRHKEYNDELLYIENLKGTICPTCRQKVDKNHTTKSQLIVLEKIDKLEAETKGLNRDLKKIKQAMDRASGEYDDQRRVFERVDRDYYGISDSISRLRTSISNLENDITSYNRGLDNLRRKENPFKEMITNNLADRKTLKERIKKYSKQIEELKVQLDATLYWVKGFKRVRLFVIEEALSALEIEVNNLLVTLGLIDWQITFDIERENKSGGVTKGFTVMIHSPKHDKPVRFESFSGGEVQRLRLAGDLGLSNLVMEQAGFENMVEIIDEPSEHLSVEGIEDLIETLSERAHETNKLIWLVEHHSLASNLFDGILLIQMDKKGRASLEYERAG